MKKFKPTSAGIRHKVRVLRSFEGALLNPPKKLLIDLKRTAGRSHGKVTVRHKGGGAKALYRVIDFKRNKREVVGVVKAIDYDPNRGASIALVAYLDGEYRYILSPLGLKLGDRVLSSEKAEVKVGNALPLRSIPLGTLIHNLEINPGRGGQLARGAGVAAEVLAREEDGRYVQVKLPSGEIKRIFSECYATIGQVTNPDRKNEKFGKAGVRRHLGIRPTVRGVAQNPRSHPHGGGEGKSGVGLKYPKSPWGKHALGKKTRRRREMDKFLVRSRRT